MTHNVDFWPIPHCAKLKENHEIVWTYCSPFLSKLDSEFLHGFKDCNERHDGIAEDNRFEPAVILFGETIVVDDSKGRNEIAH